MKNKFYILLFLVFGLCQQNMLCSKTISDSLQIAIDSSHVKNNKFASEINNRYTGSDFDYDTAEGEAQNMLARFLNWIFRGLHDTFGIEITPETIKLLENVIYFILIGIAIYILIRLLAGKEAVSFFSKKNTVVAPIDFAEEHIENVDLNQLIQEALSAKDYRLAIRYMYLKVLQELSAQHLIEYHFEKTNGDYYNEIQHTALKQKFNKVSYLYENIWYGEFELDEKEYSSAKKTFDQLYLNINNFG